MTEETKSQLIVCEEDMSIGYLSQALKDAFYEVSNITDNSFDVVIAEYRATIKIMEDKKSINIFCVDRIGDYNPALYSRLLEALNEANGEIINVCSALRHYQDEEENLLFLEVQQYVSYRCGLILQQFMYLLRNFEQIDVCIYRDYVMKVYRSFEEQNESKNRLLN